MKHLKLFEQFDPFGDKEDEWWNETDLYKDRLLCFRHGEVESGDYYLGHLETDGDTIQFFDSLIDNRYKLSGGWRIYLINKRHLSTFYIYDYEDKYDGYVERGDIHWKRFGFKNLPKEIKDRII